MVSKTNRRFVDNDSGYNFDLTWIDDRTVAMGWPATGIEGAYRNPADQVNDFLHQTAQIRGIFFKIYNLADRDYPHEQFQEIPVEQYGFPDHYPPSLELLLTILKSMSSWLTADEKNVVVVHCLAGHGRTGTVIAALHLFEGLFSTPEESLANFARKRSTAGKGVAYPSQKRAVDTAYRHLRRCVLLQRDKFDVWIPIRRVLLQVSVASVWVSPKPRKCQLLIQDHEYRTIWSSSWITGRPTPFVPLDGPLSWFPSTAVAGTFTVKLVDGKDIFRTTLYTDFLDLPPDKGRIEMHKSDLDGTHRDPDDKEFDSRLTLTLNFSAPA
jgi:hypothetical protein